MAILVQEFFDDSSSEEAEADDDFDMSLVMITDEEDEGRKVRVGSLPLSVDLVHIGTPKHCG